MNESENETVEERQMPEEPSLPERPGRRLREAREAKGISRENVATELRLNIRLVTALEEDDDSALPPPAFVIGYLRSYARRLDLPADEIVRAYEQSLEGHQPELVSRVNDTQVSSRDLPVRMVTWLIFLGLSALLVVWWLAQQPELGEAEDEEAGLSLEASPEDTAMLSEPTAQPILDLHEPESEVALPEPIAPLKEREEPVPESVVPESDVPEVEPQATLSSPETEPEAEAETVAPPQANGVDLRMGFEADSWTEVTDAEGNRLVYDLVKAGRTLRFTGKPPFRVFLGYAPGVTVYYQGEQFDHTPYMRRDIARFSLGSPEDLRSGEG